MKSTVARVFLRRLNDPANEYRRLEVLQDDSKFLLFESTLFASDPEAQRTSLSNMDSQYVILEQIWRENPGALDQSNLARFLVAQMSSETTRKLVEASAAAGFVNRNQHVFGATVVSSTGVMEKALIQSMREMRLAIKQL